MMSRSGGSRAWVVHRNRDWCRAWGGGQLAVFAALIVAIPLGAQQRIADALAIADYASGVLTSYAACGAASTPDLPPVPTLPGLPTLPGSRAPGPRHWYVAGSAGAFATNPDERESHRLFGSASARAHFVPEGSCRFDAFLTAAGTTSAAAAATVDLRWFLAPGSGVAPALELSATARARGRRAADAYVQPDATLRITGTTPNLYALTLGRLVDAVVGAKSPRLDIRARLFGGAAVPLQDPSGTRTTFAQVGGLGGLSVLHFPVSILVSSEQALGSGVPRDYPHTRLSIGAAFRLPCCERDVWIVARSGRDRATSTSWPFIALELTNLSIGR